MFCNPARSGEHKEPSQVWGTPGTPIKAQAWVSVISHSIGDAHVHHCKYNVLVIPDLHLTTGKMLCAEFLVVPITPSGNRLAFVRPYRLPGTCGLDPARKHTRCQTACTAGFFSSDRQASNCCRLPVLRQHQSRIACAGSKGCH